MKHQITLPRRDVLKAGALGLIGTFIAAATLDKAGAQQPSVENVMSNLKSLKFGNYNPNYAAHWPFRLAQALGYFKDVGIDEFEIILSEEYIPGLIGGSLDLTHGDTSNFVGAGVASGVPLKIISIYRDSEWWMLGVSKNINTIEDLKGKNVSGGQLGARNTWILKQIAKKLGLNPDTDLVFVPTSGGSDGRLGALIAGTIDATILFPRHRKGLEENGGKFLSVELTPSPQEAICATGDWLAKNEDAAYAFCRADIRARQWLMKPENKDKAYQTMIDLGYPIPPEFVALYKDEIDQISPDGGYENAEVMQAFMDQVALTGEVPAGVDWRKYFDLKYIWAAQKALGLPQRPPSL